MNKKLINFLLIMIRFTFNMINNLWDTHNKRFTAKIKKFWAYSIIVNPTCKTKKEHGEYNILSK